MGIVYLECTINWQLKIQQPPKLKRMRIAYKLTDTQTFLHRLSLKCHALQSYCTTQQVLYVSAYNMHKQSFILLHSE